MSHQYDIVVIGSGFGGAVMACRLAEQGKKVLVLERGRRWEPKDYPSVSGKNWVWDQNLPQKLNGWIDLRYFGDMSVAQGAGVGGGSLIYASVSLEAKKECFNIGWPKAISYDELKPHYDKVGEMLNIQKLPDNQLTARHKLMQQAAEKCGYGERFETVTQAVSFNEEWHYDLDDPFNVNKSKTWTNAFGQKQGTCIHCGNCDIGCEVRAKNTLDVNYIPQAEKHGAEVRPLHMVKYIMPLKETTGYRVVFERLDDGCKTAGSVTATKVVLAAGSLGSTEIMLRSKQQYKTLPKVSDRLGKRWSANGDFVSLSYHKDMEASPTQGPTIAGAIDLLDGSKTDGHQLFIEDGGFPDAMGNFLEQGAKKKSSKKLAKIFGILPAALQYKLRQRDPFDNIMVWFGQAVDSPDGEMKLKRKWYAPWKWKLDLNWDYRGSEATVMEMQKTHKKLAEAMDGELIVPPTWTWFRDLITPHPLGGCNMGESTEDGVVDHKGEVFNYPGLYIADGSIIPRPIGLNPSRTIAALAERNSVYVAED